MTDTRMQLVSLLWDLLKWFAKAIINLFKNKKAQDFSYAFFLK